MQEKKREVLLTVTEDDVHPTVEGSRIEFTAAKDITLHKWTQRLVMTGCRISFPEGIAGLLVCPLATDPLTAQKNGMIYADFKTEEKIIKKGSRLATVLVVGDIAVDNRGVAIRILNA